MNYGDVTFERLLEPVTGKAFPVLEGQVLRITQLEGGQCVDFNAFNLHDYKEHLDCGFTRGINGLRSTKGDLIWTQAPRGRPMYKILKMPKTCLTDTTGARCNAIYFEASFGYRIHTNCQDTLAECIREYGLTPDDVHDSFNMWMNTSWDEGGNLYISKNTGRRGDYVDLMAIIDTLAVPIVCGSGDVTPVSNFHFKPIKVQVFEGSQETANLVREIRRTKMSFKNQRTPKDFIRSEIRTGRELTKDPSYAANFVNYPLGSHKVLVELPEKAYNSLQRLARERTIGNNVNEVARSLFMYWYIRRQSKSFFQYGGKQIH